jgi:CheY-like chemotaxis protein
MNESHIHGMNGMMQGNEGTIAIDRAPGCDTTVAFAVPVREIASSTGQDDPPEAKAERSLLILCIDDDPQVRDFLSDCLTHFNHRVMVASGGKHGLELFRTATLQNQPYEVVITDLGMPDIDGNRVARTIKAESPNTPVIMMTGWGTTIVDDGENVPGVDIVVSKPPRMQELNDLLLRMARPA